MPAVYGPMLMIGSAYMMWIGITLMKSSIVVDTVGGAVASRGVRVQGAIGPARLGERRPLEHRDCPRHRAQAQGARLRQRPGPATGARKAHVGAWRLTGSVGTMVAGTVLPKVRR
jgi:hypothetical protein